MSKRNNFSLLSFFLSTLHFAHCTQQVPSPEPRLRNATLKDVKDIATILIAAFSPLSPWDYVYQFRHEYPSEHIRCVRSGVEQLLLQNTSYA
ncbi:hypothetical protein BU23DRAFT_467189 [Bimuria novae-zelandiae CBS 107.79]|uniref:Uncharacterized protein n=1 Tax=Bimuria novae-zelandiae CBS 107.79 TaxID=1447943 RepID=A0A6A5V6R4_9PLEO|nr:hypothetical protein BU23DRAFT_467189 [Bimuria novae-zelandiae CBS 107.79]